MALNSAYEELGTRFVQQYYDYFDKRSSSSAELAALYADEAMLTFDGELRLGRQAIMTKLLGLSFTTDARLLTSVDSQPLPDEGVLVTVIGKLSVDDSVINYSDTFVLAYVGKGLAITQHIFRTVTA
ncbi:nuclear transport factor 2 family protein [Kitasatospora sp. SC0581]|uniref:nuclear transport factor 2 family protein n=1 Tax=Kitasatospora sp. SC0581 TaxID=3394360 RepID=UPI003A8C80E3